MSDFTPEQIGIMTTKYKNGEYTKEQEKAFFYEVEVGNIPDPREEVVTEEVTEEVSPSFIDRITTSIKEKSIPEFKQDVSAIKDLGVGIKDVALKSIKNAVANPDKVMEGLFKLYLAQESPETARRIGEQIDPSGIAKSVITDLVDSAGGVVNPEDPYSWAKDVLNVGGAVFTAPKAVQVGTQAGLGALKGVGKGVGGAYRGGKNLARKAAGKDPIVRDTGIINKTEYDSAKDILNKPEIQELFSGDKKVPISKFTDPNFINQVGVDTATGLDTLKNTIIKRQEMAVTNAVLPPGLNEKIFSKLKNEGHLDTAYKTRKVPLTPLETKKDRAMLGAKTEKTVSSPIIEGDTNEEILKGSLAIKQGTASNQANLKNIIRDLNDPNLTVEEAYKIRRKADQSINYNDPKILQEPFLAIRREIDSVLRNEKFNPNWKEYAEETDNLKSLLENKTVKKLMDETTLELTTDKLGEKIVNVSPAAKQRFRKVIKDLKVTDPEQLNLQKNIIEGIDVFDMKKAYDQYQSPVFLRKLPIVGEFAQEGFKRSMPLQQNIGNLNRNLQAIGDYVAPAYLTGKSVHGGLTEARKKQIENERGIRR